MFLAIMEPLLSLRTERNNDETCFVAPNTVFEHTISSAEDFTGIVTRVLVVTP